MNIDVILFTIVIFLLVICIPCTKYACMRCILVPNQRRYKENEKNDEEIAEPMNLKKNNVSMKEDFEEKFNKHESTSPKVVILGLPTISKTQTQQQQQQQLPPPLLLHQTRVEAMPLKYVKPNLYLTTTH